MIKMIATLTCALDAIAEGMPKQWGKDAGNVRDFAKAAYDKGLEWANAGETDSLTDLLADLGGVVYMGVWGLSACAPWKASLSWLTGFDPFKAFRLAADEVARKHGLAWRRK